MRVIPDPGATFTPDDIDHELLGPKAAAGIPPHAPCRVTCEDGTAYGPQWSGWRILRYTAPPDVLPRPQLRGPWRVQPTEWDPWLYRAFHNNSPVCAQLSVRLDGLWYGDICELSGPTRLGGLPTPADVDTARTGWDLLVGAQKRRGRREGTARYNTAAALLDALDSYMQGAPDQRRRMQDAALVLYPTKPERARSATEHLGRDMQRLLGYRWKGYLARRRQRGSI
jgi:hypothetical protein